jgi:hypothetical protein
MGFFYRHSSTHSVAEYATRWPRSLPPTPLGAKRGYHGGTHGHSKAVSCDKYSRGRRSAPGTVGDPGPGTKHAFGRLTMHHKGRITMKTLLLAFISLAAATALTAAAFAGLKDAKNKAECEKAGGVWVEQDNKCGAKTE